MSRLTSIVAVALGLLTGCGDPVFNLGEGEQCTRTVQCGPGLACVMGVCDPDPTGLGGEVPGGGDTDGAVPPQPDGSVPPDQDAGNDPPEPPVDGG